MFEADVPKGMPCLWKASTSCGAKQGSDNGEYKIRRQQESPYEVIIGVKFTQISSQRSKTCAPFLGLRRHKNRSRRRF